MRGENINNGDTHLHMTITQYPIPHGPKLVRM